MSGRGRVSPNPLVGAIVVERRARRRRRMARGPGDAACRGRRAARGGRCRARSNASSARWSRAPITAAPRRVATRSSPPACARVVIGCLDPLERGRAGGATVLAEAGVDVALAPAEDADACRELNAPFITHALTGRPLVTLKLATSLDGKVATATGETRWISGPESRALVHRWRADADARRRGNRHGAGGRSHCSPHATWTAHTARRARWSSTVTRGSRSTARWSPERGEVPVVVVAGADAPPERVAAAPRRGRGRRSWSRCRGPAPMRIGARARGTWRARRAVAVPRRRPDPGRGVPGRGSGRPRVVVRRADPDRRAPGRRGRLAVTGLGPLAGVPRLSAIERRAGRRRRPDRRAGCARWRAA